jgi:hypothetical protein
MSLETEIRQAICDPVFMQEARDWCADCTWADEDFDVNDYNDHVIAGAVQRHYSGGLRAFREDIAEILYSDAD